MRKRPRAIVYLLVHERSDTENGTLRRHSKEIGVFSSRNAAENGRDQVAREEGFRDTPEGFRIVVIPLGKSSEGGYVTYYG